jgi:hypothetical protein
VRIGRVPGPARPLLRARGTRTPSRRAGRTR